MKTLPIILTLLLFTLPAIAGDIAATDAANHIGESATVRGTVQEVKVSAKAIFLDLDGRYPDEPFSVVCFSTAIADKLSALQGKAISVTGTIQLYKGKPEIILKDMSQIQAQ